MDALEVGGIRVGHAHHVVGGAGEQAAFGDFWMALDLGLEGIERGAALLVQGDQHEGGAGQAGQGLVEQHHVARDQPGFLQQLDPAQAGRGRQVDALRQLQVGQPAVRLQQAEDRAVAVIEGQLVGTHMIR